MSSIRLTAKTLAATRTRILTEQGGTCCLCMRVPQVPCLDHDHKSGLVRGVLCRGCNAMLGHIENNRARHGLPENHVLDLVLSSIVPYLQVDPHPIYHPSYKTPEEKRILINKRAKLARAKRKALEKAND